MRKIPEQGVLVDTSAFIEAERKAGSPALEEWGASSGVCLASITVSELLVGAHRMTNERLRRRTTAFVEQVLARFVVIPLTIEVARVHARIGADLGARGTRIGPHDLIIAATAACYGFAVLTKDVAEFRLVPGLEVLSIG